jgi:hypothetical protein
VSLFHSARSARGNDRFYRWKVLIFVTGGALGVAGMSSGRDWLVALGIAVLGAGIVLRMIDARQRRREEDRADHEEAIGEE